jgi:SagB-type dehydrogenase family enzyme
MTDTNGQAWPLGVRIRPPAHPAEHHAEVADVIAGRRFRWSPDSLAALILGGKGPGDGLTGDKDAWLRAFADGNDRHHLSAGWRHWQERGWYPSDQYYAASRRWRYVDGHDPDYAIRTRVVERYLAEEGPPAEESHPDGPRTELPSPAVPGGRSIARLLTGRRSGRSYASGPVPASWLSGLLWHGLAQVRTLRERTSETQPLSYLDSFGSAWDFYLCVFSVDGLAPGTYWYDIRSHQLIAVRLGDHREVMTEILQGMWSPRTAAWTLGLVADFPRYQWRYRHEQALRRLYMESGIIGQELTIVGAAYGLSTLVTPAQRDTPYLELHGLCNDRYAPIYTLTMGRDRGSSGAEFNQSSRHEEPAGPALAAQSGDT